MNRHTLPGFRKAFQPQSVPFLGTIAATFWFVRVDPVAGDGEETKRVGMREKARCYDAHLFGHSAPGTRVLADAPRLVNICPERTQAAAFFVNTALANHSFAMSRARHNELVILR